MEELLEAIAHTYLEYISPLMFLMEKISESRRLGNTLSTSQLENFVEEATTSTYTIIPLRALLSSLGSIDQGMIGNLSSRFISRIVHENVLVSLQNNMTTATTRLIKDHENASNRNKDMDRALERASRAICLELSRIRDLNGGFLPHPELKDLWENLSCTDRIQAVDLG